MKNGIAIAASILGGALVGATLGVLFAPEPGERQRRKIRVALQRRGIKLGKEEFEKLVDELKNIGKKGSSEPDPAVDYDVE